MMLPFTPDVQFALSMVLGLASIALMIGIPILWLEYLSRTNQRAEFRAPVTLRDRRERL